MSTESYNYFDPRKTLDDLQGDHHGLRLLAESYLSDLDLYLGMLISGEDSVRSAAHRLRTAFGIFHAKRGAFAAREVEQICRSGRMLPESQLRSLLEETVGLGEDLIRYLKSPPEPAKALNGLG